MSELAIADGLLLEMLEEHAGDEGWAPVFNGGSWLLLQALEELGLVERRSDAPPVRTSPPYSEGHGHARLTEFGRAALTATVDQGAAA